MLDTKESWDALVRRHAPDAETREQILANPLYQNISGRFVQSHDYIAMERLYEIHAEGKYDLIVVDTPPTRNALDFLDAPQRMADFFSSRLLRWLIVPYRSRLVNFASRPFYQVADRILGTQFLADISEFFILFQSMYDGFVERAEAVTRLLSDRRTTFMVVSTLEATPLREAEFFANELRRRKLHLGAIVLNKVLPAYFRDPPRRRVAQNLATGGRAGRGAARRPGGDRPGAARRWPRASSTSGWWPGARPSSRPSWPRAPRCWPPCRSSTPTSTTWRGCCGWATDLGLTPGRVQARLPCSHGPLIDPAVVAYAEAHSTAPAPPPGRRRRGHPAGLPRLGDDGRPPGGPIPRAAGLRRAGRPGARDRHLHRLLVHRHGRRAARRGAPSPPWRWTPTTPPPPGPTSPPAPTPSRIEVIEGPALESLAGLQGPFDLVFIDADKPGYDAYFEAVLPKLAPARGDRGRQHPLARRACSTGPTDRHEAARPCAPSTTSWPPIPGWSAS